MPFKSAFKICREKEKLLHRNRAISACSKRWIAAFGCILKGKLPLL
jgi:hypothetical protein